MGGLYLQENRCSWYVSKVYSRQNTIMGKAFTKTEFYVLVPLIIWLQIAKTLRWEVTTFTGVISIIVFIFMVAFLVCACVCTCVRNLFIFLCVYECLACMHARCPQRSEEGTESGRSEVKMAVGRPVVLGPKPSLLCSIGILNCWAIPLVLVCGFPPFGCCTCMYPCAPCACSVPREAKVSGSLELELQPVQPVLLTARPLLALAFFWCVWKAETYLLCLFCWVVHHHKPA